MSWGTGWGLGVQEGPSVCRSEEVLRMSVKSRKGFL